MRADFRESLIFCVLSLFRLLITVDVIIENLQFIFFFSKIRVGFIDKLLLFFFFFLLSLSNSTDFFKRDIWLFFCNVRMKNRRFLAWRTKKINHIFITFIFRKIYIFFFSKFWKNNLTFLSSSIKCKEKKKIETSLNRFSANVVHSIR